MNPLRVLTAGLAFTKVASTYPTAPKDEGMSVVKRSNKTPTPTTVEVTATQPQSSKQTQASDTNTPIRDAIANGETMIPQEDISIADCVNMQERKYQDLFRDGVTGAVVNVTNALLGSLYSAYVRRKGERI